MSLVFTCGRRGGLAASVVANLNRQLVILLGSSHGIDLFLGGSGNVGYGLTDMCIGWYVKPARARKEQVKIDETQEPSKSTSKNRKSSAKSKATPAEEIATHVIGTTKWKKTITWQGTSLKFSFDFPHIELKQEPGFAYTDTPFAPGTHELRRRQRVLER